MQRCICLVTNELYPITHGGCGTLIFNSTFELLAKGFRVIVLADIKPRLLLRFFDLMKERIPNSENLEIITVADLLKNIPSSHEIEPAHDALRQSFRFYKALMILLRKEKVDIVEFPDYFGWAYYTLAYFQNKTEGERPAIVTRLHLTMELIDSVTNSGSNGLYRFLIYQMERYSIFRSDRILVATQSVAEWANHFYGEKICYTVSTPSFAGLEISPRTNTDSTQNIILFYARLAPQKGAEIFVDAALRLLAERIDSQVSFVVAGPDMKHAPGGGSMVKYLRNQIPDQFQGRFVFPGNLDRNQLNHLLPDVLCAVMPSRIETYCYSARELAMAGIPTIVSDIPPFDDLIRDGACLGCRLDPADLSKKIQLLFENDVLREKFSRPWVPPPALSNVYQDIKPTSPITRANGGGKSKLSLTIVILANEETASESIDETIQTVSVKKDVNIWLAKANKEGANVVMGRRCHLFDFKDGMLVTRPVGDALCMLFAGDILKPDYLSWAIEMLLQHHDLGFVGTATTSSDGSYFDDFPWDAAPEALPFIHPGRLCRCVVRGSPKMFYERLDPRLLIFQEVDSIWAAIDRGERGLRRPEVCIRTAANSDVWAKFDKMTINSALHLLLCRYMRPGSSLRIPEVLKAMVHESIASTQDILSAIKLGQTPEVGGIRFNLKNIMRLILARIISMV